MRASAGSFLLGAAGVLLFVALFFGGASGDERLFWIGMGAFVVALVGWTAAFWRGLTRPALRPAAFALLALLVLFVAWNGLSVWWSIVPDRSWDYFNRSVVYVAFAAIGLLVGTVAPRRVVAQGLAVLLGAVLLWALAGKVVPAFFHDGARIARLRNPVGYWNALALLADIALPLYLWLAARRRDLAVLGVYVAVVALLLTYSRAGVVVAVLVVAAWFALGLERDESFGALAASLPAGLGVAAVGLALPGTAKNLQPHSVRVRDGAWFGLALLVGAIVVTYLARRDLRRIERRALAVTAAVLVAAGIGALAARGGFLSEFRGTESTEVTQSSQRLTSVSSNNRWTWWKESWRIFVKAPAGGKGAGSFEVARRPIRHNALVTTEPHNIALQFLAETGIFGLLLGAGAVLAGLWAIFEAVRRLEGPERAAAAALALAVPAYLVHALVDIDWDFVAVSAPLFLVLGVLLAHPGLAETPARRPLWALGSIVLASAAGYSLTVPWLAARDVNSAYDALGAVQPARAASDARSAHDLNPLSIDPYRAWAGAEIESGHAASALRLYEREVSLQPENSDTWYDLGAFEYQVLRDPCHAYDALNQAYTLDPYGPSGTKGGLLDRSRAVRNSGRC
jgi:O-Antigen ligase